MNAYAHHGLLPQTIPLHCNICPKKPDFSDVSHLLTHIASKGHLSHYYKTKVKASADAAAEQAVVEYDEWYEEWNVQDLMRERMNQKERKKGSINSINGTAGGGRGSGRGSAANLSASNTARSTPVAAARAPRRSYALRESTLDPQLNHTIKQEPKSRSTTPALPYALDAATMSRHFAPPMQVWSATPFVDSPMTQETSTFDSFYSTPTTDSYEDNLPKRTNKRQRGRNQSNSSRSQEADSDANMAKGGSFELKGKKYNGMNRFDAANADQKRLRNQKKGSEVLEGLQATSEAIVPTEQVYDAQWALQRERPITGEPEEDDGLGPLPGEVLPEVESPAHPKKKKAAPRKPRTALTRRNINNGRNTRRRVESHHPPFADTTRSTPYFDGGEDMDDGLTYSRPPSRPRNGLSIHRDNSGPEITFDQPAPMNTLTSAFRGPFQATSDLQPRSQSMIQNGYAARHHARQQSFSMDGGFRPAHQNPLSTFPPPSLGTFGQLTSTAMFTGNNFQTGHGVMPMSNGQQAVNSFQQQFGQHHFGSLDGFQNNNTTALQIPSAWDVFAAGQPDMPGLPATESSFSMNGDLASGNPLFFSDDRVAPVVEEDDQATISPPSERGERRER